MEKQPAHQPAAIRRQTTAAQRQISPARRQTTAARRQVRQVKPSKRAEAPDDQQAVLESLPQWLVLLLDRYDSDIAALKAETAAIKAETAAIKAETAALRETTEAKIDALREVTGAKMDASESRLRADLANMKVTLILTVIAVAGLLFAAMQFWPPGG